MTTYFNRFAVLTAIAHLMLEMSGNFFAGTLSHFNHRLRIELRSNRLYHAVFFTLWLAHPASFWLSERSLGAEIEYCLGWARWALLPFTPPEPCSHPRRQALDEGQPSQFFQWGQFGRSLELNLFGSGSRIFYQCFAFLANRYRRPDKVFIGRQFPGNHSNGSGVYGRVMWGWLRRSCWV